MGAVMRYSNKKLYHSFWRFQCNIKCNGIFSLITISGPRSMDNKEVCDKYKSEDSQETIKYKKNKHLGYFFFQKEQTCCMALTRFFYNISSTRLTFHSKQTHCSTC